MHTLTIQTLRHEGPDGSWVWHRREPSPLLRPYVLSYAGYEERNARVLLRRELPFPGVPLIITSEGVVGVERGADRSALDSFVAGPDDTFSTTDLGRRWAGIQVNLAPPAARAVLGLPLSELARRTVRLDDLPGLAAERIVERVGAASTWTERFAVLERFLLDRVARGEGVAPPVGHVWSVLMATKGRASVTELAREVGWSRQHLSARFADELGLSPKRFARVIRFDHAAGLARRDPALPWTGIAYRCGYYDQAHLVKDFQEFAGCSPSELARRVLPEGGGIGGD